MSLFECCFKCVSPKRHPGCHETCEEYLKDKKKQAELSAQREKNKVIEPRHRKWHYYTSWPRH